MKSESEFSINQRFRPAFGEALEIVKCFDFAPQTPNIASLLSLVFEITGQKSNQKRLAEWLYDYIDPFLLNPIRDEQNIAEKTLAIATFLYISSKIELDRNLSEELLINYLEYASKQSWFEDHFLAFYCSFLKDQIVACENIVQFFEKNLEQVINKKHVQAICQSLIVLNGIIADTEKERAYKILLSQLQDDVWFSHAAWAFWALAYSKNENTLSTREELLSILENEIENNFVDAKKDSGISGLSVLVAMGASSEQLQEYIKRLKQAKTIKQIEYSTNNGSVTINIKSVRRPTNTSFSVFDLGLAILSLSHQKYDKVTFVSGLEVDDLQRLSDQIKRLTKVGGIDLSKGEKWIVNTLVVIIIFLILITTIYLQLGGALSLDFSNLKFSNWSFEEVVISITLLDYLVGVIQAARTTGNAVKGLLKLPLLRHLRLLGKGKEE